MLPKLRPLLVGAVTFIPGCGRLLSTLKVRAGLGGAASARYCYAVWMRHIVTMSTIGAWRIPRCVAELGPGDSLGVGLCALLSGAERYLAFDVMNFASPSRNLAVFDELVDLFRARSSIPGEDEFPEITPKLNSYEFPKDVLQQQLLEGTLAPLRLSEIRRTLKEGSRDSSVIEYRPHWQISEMTERGTVDLILSQAVLEHVEELRETYEALNAWLAPSGIMSHSIDFRCHNMFKVWNGHWAVNSALWKIVVGKRPYLLNRQPLSRHIEIIESLGMDVVGRREYRLPSTLRPEDLAVEFKSMHRSDLEVGMATLVVRTRANC